MIVRKKYLCFLTLKLELLALLFCFFRVVLDYVVVVAIVVVANVVVANVVVANVVFASIVDVGYFCCCSW